MLLNVDSIDTYMLSFKTKLSWLFLFLLDWNVSLVFNGQFWSSDHEYAICGQVWHNCFSITSLWQGVLPGKMSGDMSITIIWFFFMFSLHFEDIIGIDVYFNFIWSVGWGVQADLKIFIVIFYGDLLLIFEHVFAGLFVEYWRQSHEMTSFLGKHPARDLGFIFQRQRTFGFKVLRKRIENINSIMDSLPILKQIFNRNRFHTLTHQVKIEYWK